MSRPHRQHWGGTAPAVAWMLVCACAPWRPDPADYDRSCTRDSQCVLQETRCENEQCCGWPMNTEGAERYREADARAPCRPGPAMMQCLCESVEPVCVRGACDAVPTYLLDGGT